MEFQSHHSLIHLNTFGIEAFAREFTEVTSDDDLLDIINDNLTHSKRLLFLGGGSNILFKDDFEGLVIKISTRGIEPVLENEKEVHLRVAAGEDWDELVGYTVSSGWGGLENLSGIPGKVGSSPIQNIGAYGTELKDHFVSLEAINTCTGEKISFDAERCRFGYRDSIFKGALKGRVVISHVVFRLQKEPVFNLTYPALRQMLKDTGVKDVTLKMIREAVLEIRSSKLPDPKRIGNAGSFFKNPVVGYEMMGQLKERFPGIIYFENSKFQIPNSKQIPNLNQLVDDTESVTAEHRPPTACFKLSAGWLIEQCGWKGFRQGDAGVHKDQALVMVNYGKATGREILALAGKIQHSVNEKFGIELEREVNVV